MSCPGDTAASTVGPLRNPQTTRLELNPGVGEIECVFAVLGARLQAAAKRATAAVREALRPAPLVTGFVADLSRTRDELLTENAMLR